MRSWNDSVHFCNWTGLTCSPTNGRVTILNLDSQNLVGSIPPSIGNLTFLNAINLGNNSFHGKIPPEIGRLQRLQNLTLDGNQFGGRIPTNISGCTNLRKFKASYNEFNGQIPDEISSLLKLEILSLGRNNLTGRIPASIGNLSSLSVLSLGRNNLQGSIPEELGLLSDLTFFHVGANYLSGFVPSSIYNLSSIYFFSVASNQLQGELPSYVGLTLRNLEVFLGGVNNFTGNIPASLPNASNLQQIELGVNGFTGSIPGSFGRLKSLVKLSFEFNRLGNGEIGDLNFVTFLANCTNLTLLGLVENRFGGELPKSIGNLSTQLQFLTLGSNLIHGEIPVGIGNLVNLQLLGLENNHLSGTVPDVIGRLNNLETLYLNQNNFSGSIPSSLGNLTKLIALSLAENKFQGSIPPTLGNCQKLQLLILSSNRLNGTVPKHLMSLSSLTIYFGFSYNFLTGPLPLEVDNLKSLAELDISNNNLSGEIPRSLGSCTSLERLYLGSNMFEGTIPSLENLKGLEEIDLSHNNLSGQIPTFLGKLIFLKYLNLSYNKLHGEVPIFANQSANISLVGNDDLCGGAPQLLLPVCSKEGFKRHISKKVVISIISGIIIATLLASSFVLYYKRKSSQKNCTTSLNENQLRLSFFDILKSTDNFSDENLIGVGSFGSVYKGILSGDGKVVAIKVLKFQQQGALKSFIDECNALKSIRHRNILKVITVCSSVDYEGNDFKCLIFEFMPKGSLDKWLYPNLDEQLVGIKKLTLMQRLNIAIDVASAFDYLHHHCEIPIVHCDLKPSNVLLDEDMAAHVGDFGLARFLYESSDNVLQSQIMSGGLRGSIGYIPPEHMDGYVSRLGDIYNYGILLLEMFIGKRPIDDMFKDDLNIHKFVSMAFPNHFMDIVDPSLLFEEENEDDEIEEAMIRNFESQTSNKKKMEEFLVPVMRIGLMCSTTSPRERMAMNDVVNNIKSIRDSFIKFKDRNKQTRR
ncbi:putative receptor-like protein kinase At3g47110 isoform X2 [Pistacia vera]|uniref:putative receptor-like protein kinase At3g47110 isoform X2 n=1 Tax=Pistacia vera TaxID=55513 RepID=UPI001263257D|nr:putative receptor-like protein kinase At3g47110 isoform X2 [Pistacia vera]